MTRARLLASLAPLLDYFPGDEFDAPEARVAAIADRIYQRCHLLAPADARAGARPRDRTRARELISAFSRANSGVGPWHEGWRVLGPADDGTIPVERGGLRLWAPISDVRGDVSEGNQVRVHFPKEYRNLYPGFYVMLGDHDDSGRGGKIRFYWHLTADGGATIVRRISALLNAAGIAFRFKLLSDPDRYCRTDAGVLYVPADVADEAMKFLSELYGEVRSQLRDSVSSFVHELAPGIGVAEDQPDGASFGIHRSRILAPLVLEAKRQGQTLEQLGDRIAATGYDPGRFYVNPGSTRQFSVWS